MTYREAHSREILVPCRPCHTGLPWRRGDGEIIDLKDHAHCRGHLQHLARIEAELSVIVEHSIHIFYPDGVDRAIEEHPLAVWCRQTCRLAVHAWQHTVNKFTRVGVKLTVELPNRDALWILTYCFTRS